MKQEVDSFEYELVLCFQIFLVQNVNLCMREVLKICFLVLLLASEIKKNQPKVDNAQLFIAVHLPLKLFFAKSKLKCTCFFLRLRNIEGNCLG